MYVTVYDADGNAISVPKTDFIRDYAMRMFGKRGESFETVPDDMLNYGAAVQPQFNHRINTSYVGKTATVIYTDHYGKAHNYAVTGEASDSMDKVSYCARMIALAPGEPLMKFAASARAYFNR